MLIGGEWVQAASGETFETVKASHRTSSCPTLTSNWRPVTPRAASAC
jgi:hypothetical protein